MSFWDHNLNRSDIERFKFMLRFDSRENYNLGLEIGSETRKKGLKRFESEKLETDNELHYNLLEDCYAD